MHAQLAKIIDNNQLWRDEESTSFWEDFAHLDLYPPDVMPTFVSPQPLPTEPKVIYRETI